MQTHKGIERAEREPFLVPERPRYLSLAIALALTLGLAPAASAEDTPMAGREMNADASWMFPKAEPGTFTGYLVFAIDQEPSEGPDVFSMAIVMSGPCRQEGDMTSCRGKHGGLYDLKPGQMQVAADWSSATLNVGKKNERVSLTWTPEVLLFPTWTGSAGGSSGDPDGDYEYETEGFGISRPATVGGTMFGRTLGADGFEYGSFYRGEYRGTYRSGDRTLRIGSVVWHLPSFA